MVRFFERTRPFWMSFYLTLCVFAVITGLLTVDYRCRMMTAPPDGRAASFSVTGLTVGDGTLHVQWFDAEAELSLQTSASLRRVLETIPILIPRSLRIAAGGEKLLEDLWEQLPTL